MIPEEFLIVTAGPHLITGRGVVILVHEVCDMAIADYDHATLQELIQVATRHECGKR